MSQEGKSIQPIKNADRTSECHPGTSNRDIATVPSCPMVRATALVFSELIPTHCWQYEFKKDVNDCRRMPLALNFALCENLKIVI